MMEKFKTWLKIRVSTEEQALPVNMQKKRAPVISRPKKPVQTKPGPNAGDPEKNVLIRNKYIREETGTHETLKILDDSLVDTGEETGIDPYNTGAFDRSKNWNNRFRK